ncbi:hypothetical protein FHG87_005442 [Trinorchestia longiramus]|nr:hypothetical protein FHG87_005442 [Trinorchestia longiramus]
MGLGYNGMGLGYRGMGLGYNGMGLGYSSMGLGCDGMGLGYNGMGLGYNGTGLVYNCMGLGYNGTGLGCDGIGLGEIFEVPCNEIYVGYKDYYKQDVLGHIVDYVSGGKLTEPNTLLFALHSFPKCNYEKLRDILVLPCKRKLQYVTSSIDKNQMLRETFDKVQTLQQKIVFLSVDEVQIRLTAEEYSLSSDLCKEGPVG